MKKIVSCFMFLCLISVLTGCGASKELKTIKCKLEKNDVVSNYKINSTYEINYEGKVAKKVNSKETVTSDNSSIIDTFKTTVNSTYEAMSNAYGGYDYKVDTTDNSVVSTVTIDYTKMNLKQLKKDDSTMSSMMNDKNEILASKLKEMYEAMGATCE